MTTNITPPATPHAAPPDDAASDNVAQRAEAALASKAAEAKAAAEAEAKAKAAATPSVGARVKRGLSYTTGFIDGTFEHGFGTMGKWGRKGIWVGGGVGLLMAISGAGLIMPFMGMAAGLAAGAIAGATFGTLTGGVRNVNRIKRVEDNADQVQARANTEQLRRSAVRRGPDYRERFNDHQLRQNFITDRVIQQERELRRDSFVDRLNNEGRNNSRGF